MQLHRVLWGKERGDFHPSQPLDDLIQLISTNKKRMHPFPEIFAPRCDFTTRIVESGKDDDIPDPVSSWFIRTKQPADGGIVDGPFKPVMIFNADCPVVAVLDTSKPQLAVLHAGFSCLVPPACLNRKAPASAKRGIIQVLFEDHGFTTGTSQVFVGYGIGPCCYGATNRPEIDDPTLDIRIGRATRGPRAGQRSVDLYQMIEDQFLKLGIPKERIEMDSACTACCRDFGVSLYHSHCWDGPVAGRNAAMFFFSK